MADGHRKDGKPYKEGNTRPDGDYGVGKGRTPEATRFAVGDGRKRGQRKKGSRNFDKDWEEELTRSVRVVRNGKATKVSAHHAQSMKTLELANKGKERSQELVFRQAERLGENTRQLSTRGDDELIAAWLAELSASPEEPIIVSDDADEQAADEAHDDNSAEASDG